MRPVRRGGWLSDTTGSKKAGMWVVGLAMFLAAILVLLLRGAPRPDLGVEQLGPEVDQRHLEVDELV